VSLAIAEEILAIQAPLENLAIQVSVRLAIQVSEPLATLDSQVRQAIQANNVMEPSSEGSSLHLAA